jgi:hypothetical protein
VVATAVREALESLHVHYPVVGKAQKRDLATARRLIARQK